jgi:predicted nucleic acid-binding Zn ribbon protein
MPVYTFENTKTGEEFTEFLAMSDKDTYLKKNPHLRQVITSINIVGGIQGITHKTDDGWKENMSRIAAAHPTSPLADRYGKKSIKQVKTEQAIAKHKKRKK